MAYWLMKSEPGSYSWNQLLGDRSTEWDGVPQSRSAAAPQGDEDRGRGVLLSQRRRAADRRDHAHRPRSAARPEGRELGLGRSRTGAAVGPVTLKQIKAEPKLAKMELIRQSRLS